jgi:hypothetical protein
MIFPRSGHPSLLAVFGLLVLCIPLATAEFRTTLTGNPSILFGMDCPEEGSVSSFDSTDVTTYDVNLFWLDLPLALLIVMAYLYL